MIPKSRPASSSSIKKKGTSFRLKGMGKSQIRLRPNVSAKEAVLISTASLRPCYLEVAKNVTGSQKVDALIDFNERA